MINILLVASVTTLACSLLGPYLVLRKLSMTADAISHSVLLGIVLAFFITYDLKSPLLIIGAIIFGLFSVYFIESLGKTKKVNYQDAIGVVFPMFFAMAVILISRFARNVHLDTDIVLMGELIFTSLDTVSIGSLVLPLAFIKMLILFIINLIVIIALFQKIKIICFDSQFAFIKNIRAHLIYYLIITLTCITIVNAFDSVGSILVLSLLIGPAASAFLITKRLYKMYIYSLLIGLIDTLIGTVFSVIFNTSISGMIAFVIMIHFILILCFHKEGIIRQIIVRKQRQKELYKQLFIIHIGNHQRDGRYPIENNNSLIYKHLHWSDRQLKRVIRSLMMNHFIELNNNCYQLTDRGQKYYNELMRNQDSSI